MCSSSAARPNDEQNPAPGYLLGPLRAAEDGKADDKVEVDDALTSVEVDDLLLYAADGGLPLGRMASASSRRNRARASTSDMMATY
jgi:hypothetical protein